MKFEKLRSDRLVLRKFRKADLQFVFDHFANPDVSRFLYDHEPPKTLKEGKDILKWCMDFRSKDHLRWCIEIEELGGKGDGAGGREEEENERVFEGRPIGTCGFHCYDPKTGEAEIGYDLRKEYWNKGLMTEALGVMLKYGGEALGIERAIAYVFVENNGSMRVLEKLGFTNEGIQSEMIEYQGKRYDHFRFANRIE